MTQMHAGGSVRNEREIKTRWIPAAGLTHHHNSIVDGLLLLLPKKSSAFVTKLTSFENPCVLFMALSSSSVTKNGRVQDSLRAT